MQGLSDIGLGNLLGSNIIAVPAIVTVAYLAAQTQTAQDNISQNNLSQQTATETNAIPKNAIQTTQKSEFKSIASWTGLQLKPEALTAQAVPYLVVIAIAALLTIPSGW